MEFVKLNDYSIKRIGMFTDIHFGCHHNSTQHNQDCLDYVNWFLTECRKNDVDTIFFLGDWFENRNAISVLTSKYSIEALRLLNDSGMEIFLIVGNHDLYHRHNRDVHSAEMFKELKHITVIDHPTQVGELLLLPFLFKQEYPLVVNQVNASKFVFGHFEFRNFYITGSNTKAEHGYHHKLFDGPTHIFSGHFHKRQANDNVIYIGNPFGTSYADAGDYERGCCFLDTTTSVVDFLDYDGPTYLKTQLSALLSNEVDIRQGARIRCLLDIDVSYSEAQTLKKECMETFKLRELILEENTVEQQQALTESAIAELDELDLASLDETVKRLIETGVQATTTIDPKKLIALYEEL